MSCPLCGDVANQADADRVRQFRVRVVQDALNHASAEHWERRATQLETALPREGDYLGQSTPEQREAHRLQIQQRAGACRKRAQIERDAG